MQLGKTTTYSPALKVGTVLTGTVTDAAGNADFEHAKPVSVPKKGTLTADLVIVTG